MAFSSSACCEADFVSCTGDWLDP